MKDYVQKDKGHICLEQGGNNCFNETEEETIEGKTKNGPQQKNITYDCGWPQGIIAYKEEKRKWKAAVKQLAHMITCGWSSSFHCYMISNQKTSCDWVMAPNYSQAKIATWSQKARVTTV